MWVCVYTYLTILAFFIFALNVISCLYITNFMFCYIIILSFVFPEIIVLQETSHMLALCKLGLDRFHGYASSELPVARLLPARYICLYRVATLENF